MENSSRSQTLQDSPIALPSNGFRWPATVWFIIGAAVLFFLLVIVIGIAWGVSQHFTAYQTARSLAGMPGVIIQSIAEIVIIGYIVALLPAIAGTSLYGLGFRRITGAQVSAIVLAAIAMFAIVTPLASLFQTALHFKQPEEAIAVFTQTSGWRRAAFAFFGVVVAPLFEEAVFRWTLFNAMRRWWGFWPGAIASSVLFGLAHAQPPFTGAMFICISLPLAVGGLILCFVYARTNNAWSNFITHGAFNGLSLILLVLFPQLAK